MRVRARSDPDSFDFIERGVTLAMLVSSMTLMKTGSFLQPVRGHRAPMASTKKKPYRDRRAPSLADFAGTA